MNFFKAGILVFLFFASVACSERAGETIVITGSTTVAPIVADAAIRYEQANPGIRIDVQTGGSSRGISDTRSGLADLGMASRELKPDEAKDLNANCIAIDGVGLIVNSANAISGLSLDQVRKIYRNEITDWSELGGSPGKITVANKADGTGTLEVFLNYLGLDSADIVADVIVAGNQQAIKTIAGTPNAIGYVSIGAASAEITNGTSIRLLKSDGVTAETAMVANGKFPITRPLLVVSKSENVQTTDFLAYLQSENIHDIIASHLYVPAAQ